LCGFIGFVTFAPYLKMAKRMIRMNILSIIYKSVVVTCFAITIVLLSQGCKEEQNAPALPTQNQFKLIPDKGRPGATVTIKGDGFEPEKDDNTVTFNGVKAQISASHYSSDGEDTLVVKVPFTATSGIVSITTKTATIKGAEFTVIGPHTITSISPSEGFIGTEVIINGNYFSSALAENIVMLNSQPLQVIAATETSLKVVVPVGAFTGKISIDILGLKVEGPVFTVTKKIETTILDVSPQQGQVGTNVIITGIGFSAEAINNNLTFNGVKALVKSATVQNNQVSLSVVVPDGASSGPIVVKADGREIRWTTKLNNSPESPLVDKVFEVPTKAPYINKLTLFPLTFLPGFKFTFEGSDFSPALSMNTVTIGAVKLNVITSSETGSFLEVEVPRNVDFGNESRISGNLIITVNGRSYTVDTNVSILKKPIITLDTKTGKVGDEIIIKGIMFPQNDGKGVKVFFTGSSGKIVASVVGVKYTELKVIVPNEAITGELFVQLYDGELSSSILSFTVTK
jgi:IPT/TIG domain